MGDDYSLIHSLGVEGAASSRVMALEVVVGTLRCSSRSVCKYLRHCRAAGLVSTQPPGRVYKVLEFLITSCP